MVGLWKQITQLLDRIHLFPNPVLKFLLACFFVCIFPFNHCMQLSRIEVKFNPCHQEIILNFRKVYPSCYSTATNKLVIKSKTIQSQRITLAFLIKELITRKFLFWNVRGCSLHFNPLMFWNFCVALMSRSFIRFPLN